jgi:hypothetical protein
MRIVPTPDAPLRSWASAAVGFQIPSGRLGMVTNVLDGDLTMAAIFESIFVRLRSILKKHAGAYSVKERAGSYSLEGVPGPATLRAWGGKIRKPMIPVAWVQVGKAYVSFHLTGMDGNAKLRDAMSKQLAARMQGKTCFNFKISDEVLFQELEGLTATGLDGFRKAGFVAE